MIILKLNGSNKSASIMKTNQANERRQTTLETWCIFQTMNNARHDTGTRDTLFAAFYWLS
jgi:hypothetical protein